MTEQDKHTLNERIARLGEEAGLAFDLLWQAAEACPQGHTNREPECGELDLHIGDICFDCRDEANVSWKEHQEHWDDPTWHPEWRIGKAPRDFTDPAVLLPLMEAYWGNWDVDIKWEWYLSADGWMTYVNVYKQNWKVWIRRKGVGATITEAMAQVLEQIFEAAGGDL